MFGLNKYFFFVIAMFKFPFLLFLSWFSFLNCLYYSKSFFVCQ
nr:MAG TPA: hypothetical protein [Caudoviricetes sp.]